METWESPFALWVWVWSVGFVFHIVVYYVAQLLWCGRFFTYWSGDLR